MVMKSSPCLVLKPVVDEQLDDVVAVGNVMSKIVADGVLVLDIPQIEQTLLSVLLSLLKLRLWWCWSASWGRT